MLGSRLAECHVRSNHIALLLPIKNFTKISFTNIIDIIIIKRLTVFKIQISNCKK